MVSTLQLGGPQPRWAVRLTTLVFWALALFSAGYWTLKFMAIPSEVATAPPALRAPPPVQPEAVARLLGASPQGAVAAGQPPAPNLAGRLVLTGVVADRKGGGAALIAVDGRPPRPFLVGSQVDEGLVLQAVDGRRVMLGEELGGPHAVVLELPAASQSASSSPSPSAAPSPATPRPLQLPRNRR